MMHPRDLHKLQRVWDAQAPSPEEERLQARLARGYVLANRAWLVIAALLAIALPAIAALALGRAL